MNILKIRNLKLSNTCVFLAGLILIGCGGGSSSDSVTLPSVTNNNLQPRSLSSADMSNVQILAREAAPAPTVTNNSDSITITHTGSEISNKLHYQFFINTDNNAATGYNFDNVIWDDAGTDYIVEDGDLFKSKANNSTWSWDTNVGEVDYKLTDSSVSVTINQSLLEGLAPQIRIGFIIRDENWDIVSIWPGASLMAVASLDIEPPTDTVPPVITLNGSQNISLQLGSVFNDPGATAFDNFDGDITDQIQSNSNIDTSTVGTYQVVYEVNDLAGNLNTAVRTITVSENTSNSIVVDGDISDWTDIPVLTSSGVGSIKVSDSITNLYILVEGYQPLGENTQIFIDSNNNNFSGFRFDDAVWSEGGADYMVENNLLSSSTENSTNWAWEHNYRPISYIKSNNIIEVAIPKSILKIKRNLEPKLRVGFVNRDKDWNVESVLPEAGMEEHTLTAINDLDLIPGFCGKLYETDGTAENTQESFLNTYQGTWANLWQRKDGILYGVRHIPSSNDNLISFEKYQGTFQNVQYLPFNVVRTELMEDGRVTAMKFVNDVLYFIFENELWRTDGTGAGSIRLKIFENDSSRNLSLFTTSSEVYVYEKSFGNTINNLWKLENGEFLTLQDLSDDEFIGFYNDNLYTRRLDESGKYFVVENKETLLSPSFTAKPRLSSTNGALFISDATFNDDGTKSFWRLQENEITFKRVTNNNPGGAGSASTVFSDISYLNGTDFVLKRFQAFINPQIVSIFKILQSGEKELVEEARDIKVFILNEKLYFDIYNNTQISTNQFTSGAHTLKVVDNIGDFKTIATCESIE